MRLRMRWISAGFALFLVIPYSSLTYSYLCREELSSISCQLYHLDNELGKMPEECILSDCMLLRITTQLGDVEKYVSQAHDIYNDHTLLVLSECDDDDIQPIQFSTDHREQPLIVCNIRRYIESIRERVRLLQREPANSHD